MTVGVSVCSVPAVSLASTLCLTRIRCPINVAWMNTQTNECMRHYWSQDKSCPRPNLAYWLLSEAQTQQHQSRVRRARGRGPRRGGLGHTAAHAEAWHPHGGCLGVGRGTSRTLIVAMPASPLRGCRVADRRKVKMGAFYAYKRERVFTYRVWLDQVGPAVIYTGAKTQGDVCRRGLWPEIRQAWGPKWGIFY